MSRYVFFALIGLLVYLPLLFPVVFGRVRLHSLYGWMIASATIGLVVRPTYLLFFSRDRTFDEGFFWRDVPTEAFFLPAAYVALGSSVLAAAYLSSVGGDSSIPSVFRHVESPSRMRLVATVLSLVGIVAAVSFVQDTGGFNLQSLSTKRVVASEASIQRGLQSVGVASAVGRAGLIASVLLFHLRKSQGLSSGIAGALVVANLFLPFYASDRTGLLLVLLQLSALTALRVGRLDRRKLLAIAAIVLLLLQLLTSLRVAGRSDQSISFSGIDGTVDVVVNNRSFFDLSKNLHVPRAAGNELEFRFGGTAVGAVFGPIPRSIWSGKPLVSVGPEVGQTIYGTSVAGVPPGLIGESFWNFHVGGLLIVLLAGVLFGRLDRVDPGRLSPFFQVAFVFLVLPLAYNAVASSFAGVALDIYRDGFSMLLLWVGHRILPGKRPVETRVAEPTALR